MSPITDEQFAAFAAAKLAVAAEQAAVNEGWPSPVPAVSDKAKELMRKGGIEAVVDSGECPDCATALVSHRMAVAAHNRRMAALTDAKLAAGYDKARAPLALRLEELSPRGHKRGDLTDAETKELAAIVAALGE